MGLFSYNLQQIGTQHLIHFIYVFLSGDVVIHLGNELMCSKYRTKILSMFICYVILFLHYYVLSFGNYYSK